MKQIDLKDQYFGTEIEMTGMMRLPLLEECSEQSHIISVLTIPGV